MVIAIGARTTSCGHSMCLRRCTGAAVAASAAEISGPTPGCRRPRADIRARCLRPRVRFPSSTAAVSSGTSTSSSAGSASSGHGRAAAEATNSTQAPVFWKSACSRGGQAVTVLGADSLANSGSGRARADQGVAPPFMQDSASFRCAAGDSDGWRGGQSIRRLLPAGLAGFPCRWRGYAGRERAAPCGTVRRKSLVRWPDGTL